MYALLHRKSLHFIEPYTVQHVPYKCTPHCTPHVYTVQPVSLHQVYNCSSISESVQQLSALAPINSTQPRYSYNLCYNMYCISSVFVSNLYCFCIFTAEFKCTHCTDVHHPESEPSIWHFHGFQVIANWRLAQIARTLELLQKSKQKIRKLWWYVKLGT